ncbi:hypothetical protein D3C85_1303680 [compost metagenome]
MDDLITAVANDQQRGQVRQRIDNCEGNRVPAGLGHRFFQKFAVDVLELLLVHTLHRKAADNGNALNPFMQISLNGCQCLGPVFGQHFQALV